MKNSQYLTINPPKSNIGPLNDYMNIYTGIDIQIRIAYAGRHSCKLAKYNSIKQTKKYVSYKFC